MKSRFGRFTAAAAEVLRRTIGRGKLPESSIQGESDGATEPINPYN